MKCAVHTPHERKCPSLSLYLYRAAACKAAESCRTEWPLRGEQVKRFFFFQKIPIGQIEIFFFFFSRSVLIRRRTKNARAYCVLKTVRYFPIRRKRVEPPRWSSDSSAFLVHAQMDRWEFVREFCWLYSSSRTAGLRLFGWACTIQVRAWCFFDDDSHRPLLAFKPNALYLFIFHLKKNTSKCKKKEPWGRDRDERKAIHSTMKWRAFRLSGAFLSSTWSEHRVRD